ncbi:MAG: DNA polymerase III subunit beta [Alphaproteobacteria bacterium]
MKLTLERAVLLRSLSHVQNVVERRATVPILSSVRLEAAGGEMRLNATDMDLEIALSAPADVARGGATTTPAHTLFDIVRNLPEGSQVELELIDETGQLALRSGRSKFSLACMDVEAFPLMAGVPQSHQFSMAAADLRSLMDRTRFAISTEETRYYLNGIYLHAGRSDGVEVLRSVATDGHRLARMDVPLPPGAAGMPGVIVPRKTVGELCKLIDNVSGEVEVRVSESKIRFAFDETVLTSKLIDGTFPDYERVIPEGNDKILQVNCKRLVEAVNLVSAVSVDKTRAIKVSLSDGSLTLSAFGADSSSGVDELEAEYEAEAMEIGFNARYLLDILGQITGENVRFALANSGSPTMVREAADASAVYVLMPMRV